MKLIEFTIKQPNGHTEKVEVALATVRIGTGAHCEIRLPSHLKANEYVRVELDEQSARLESLSFDPPPLLDGSSFTRAVVDDTAELGIGDVVISLRLTEDEVLARRGTSKQQGLSPLSVIGAILCVPLLVFILMPQGKKAPLEVPKPDAPLFAESKKACPTQDHTSALAIADREWLLGSARAERAPFFPGDGVTAVSHFEQAAACLEAASQEQEAQLLIRDATRLKEELSLEFRAHRVRMEYAISESDWSSVSREVTALRSFTKNASGEFATWLASAERRLKVEGRL